MLKHPKLLAMGAGLLSATGFAPLGLWPLTLLCLALVFHLVRKAPSTRAAAARGYWFAVGHFTIGLNWIAGSFAYQSAMPSWLGWAAVVGLSLYLAVFPAAALAAAHRAARNLPDAGFVLLMAAFWPLNELLRATVFTGFAWNPLAAAFVGAAHASQWIGTYGVSALAMMLAGAIWLISQGRTSGHNARWASFALASFPIAIGIAAALTPAPKTRPDAPLLHVVQPNIGQQDKHDPAFDTLNFRKLEAHTGAPEAKPRLILWPEAAVPDYLAEDAGARLKIASLLGPKDMLLTGGVALEYDADGTVSGARNSVFALTPQAELLGRYDKAHLVPYGEYLPMRPILSAIGLSRLVPGDLDFWPGKGPQTLNVPGFGKIGLQICYEMIFSGHVVDAAHRPDFIFNPSNDAWFGPWGPPQHLAQARLRAMEEGLPVVRSTPTGISAIIDTKGQLLAVIPAQQAGSITQALPAAAEPTLFARYGNGLVVAFALLLTALGIATRRALR